MLAITIGESHQEAIKSKKEEKGLNLTFAPEKDLKKVGQHVRKERGLTEEILEELRKEEELDKKRQKKKNKRKHKKHGKHKKRKRKKKKKRRHLNKHEIPRADKVRASKMEDNKQGCLDDDDCIYGTICINGIFKDFYVKMYYFRMFSYINR